MNSVKTIFGVMPNSLKELRQEQKLSAGVGLALIALAIGAAIVRSYADISLRSWNQVLGCTAKISGGIGGVSFALSIGSYAREPSLKKIWEYGDDQLFSEYIESHPIWLNSQQWISLLHFCNDNRIRAQIFKDLSYAARKSILSDEEFFDHSYGQYGRLASYKKISQFLEAAIKDPKLLYDVLDAMSYQDKKLIYCRTAQYIRDIMVRDPVKAGNLFKALPEQIKQDVLLMRRDVYADRSYQEVTSVNLLYDAVYAGNAALVQTLMASVLEENRADCFQFQIHHMAEDSRTILSLAQDKPSLSNLLDSWHLSCS